jgi:N-acyl-D-amino-acid deacylase
VPAGDERVILADGWVVDGTGGPAFRADVSLVGDRIEAVGRLGESAAGVRIDCADRFVLPGLVDVHSHADATVFEPDVQLAALAQGVTSVVVGQDGTAFAPGSPQTARYTTRYFGAINGRWPGDAPPRTIAEQLGAYDNAVALNVGVLVPQGNLRYEVVGPGDVPADERARAAMSALLEQAIDEGALGMSSGLDYVPSRFADAGELAHLCRSCAARDVPYVTHMRGYESAAASGLDEVARIARGSGAAVHVSHYHGPANMLIGLVDELRAGDVDLTFDSYPYTSGASILAMVALPPAIQADGPERTVDNLGEMRASLIRDWFPAKADDLARARLSYVDAGEYRWAEGLSIPDAAERAGVSVPEFVCDVLVAARMVVGCVFRQPPTNTDADVRALMRHDVHMGGSDAIFLGSAPHPRGWGTFARYLGHHTRELADWTWPQAASHLAGHPARRFGLRDRGVLRAGNAADVVVLNPRTIDDVATYDDPRRPARGVDRVYVNGVLAFAGGSLTGATPGGALRRAATW